MTRHVGDEIPGMLRGDLLRQEALTTTAHLRVCSDCRDELISALLGHIGLASTARLLHETALIEHSRSEPVPVISETTARNWRSRRIGLTAAAAAVLAIAGVAVVTLPHGSATRSVSLSAYGVGTSNASVELVGGSDVDIQANLPALVGGRYYEAWLTDAARTVMTPVGRVASSGSTELSLSRDVVSRFGDIEVSVQSSANGSQYSGVSVLRGQYKPA